jgi:hypothetical protein
MNIIAIIIVIVILIVIILCLYPYIKYYYLKKFKPNDFVIYVDEKWLKPELDNFNNHLIQLENEINLLNNNTNQALQTVQMGFQMINNLTNHEAPKAAENSLYDRIENESNQCINSMTDIRKYVQDISYAQKQRNDNIQTINNIIEKLKNIKQQFVNNTFGLLRTIEDASKMSKEKELKEKCIALLTDIKRMFDEMVQSNVIDYTNDDIDKPIEVIDKKEQNKIIDDVIKTNKDNEQSEQNTENKPDNENISPFKENTENEPDIEQSEQNTENKPDNENIPPFEQNTEDKPDIEQSEENTEDKQDVDIPPPEPIPN